MCDAHEHLAFDQLGVHLQRKKLGQIALAMTNFSETDMAGTKLYRDYLYRNLYAMSRL